MREQYPPVAEAKMRRACLVLERHRAAPDDVEWEKHDDEHGQHEQPRETPAGRAEKAPHRLGPRLRVAHDHTQPASTMKFCAVHMRLSEAASHNTMRARSAGISLSGRHC